MVLLPYDLTKEIKSLQQLRPKTKKHPGESGRQ